MNWTKNCFGGCFVLKLELCITGGESVAENCQILQSRVNRFKANKDEVDTTQLKGYSCDIKFTGMIAPFSLILHWAFRLPRMLAWLPDFGVFNI